MKIIPFLIGIFGIKDEKSPVLAKKITKKFRSHVLNSLLVGRLAAGEPLDTESFASHQQKTRIPRRC
jgi:hypothetical protein